MANVDTHAPGTLCWAELGTTNQDAAKKFYQSVLGWTPVDHPMGPGFVYTMFTLDGRNAGACYTLTPDMPGENVPPHWLLYVSVSDADQTASKVARAGGKLLKEPFDVMEFGRMGVLQDPNGAVIAFWQPKTHPGFGIEGAPGTLCWADLMTPDQPGAAKFYEAIFGWKTEAGKDNSGYLHIKTGDKFIGGIPPAEHRNPNAPPHWMAYFLVANCDASTEKAKSAGANILMPPMSMEGVGRWSVVADPAGAVFALFQSAH